MATERQTIRISADVSSLKNVFKALNAMDREAQIGIKDDVMSISQWVAEDVRAAGKNAPFYPRQASYVADTVKASRDRLPTITIGGSKRANVSRKATPGSPKPTVGELLFGNEFGGDRNAYGTNNAFPNGGYRFPERSDREGRGNAGYWIFPTVKGLQGKITQEWKQIILGVEKLWSK